MFGPHRRERIVFLGNFGDARLGRLKKGLGRDKKSIFREKCRPWEPFGTHFETAASQSRADKRFVALFCQSFFESVFRSVPKRVFRGNC